MKLKKKKAFTLTELLIVVMVLGVLAAVAVPKFSKVLETQKTTEAEELMAAVRTEQEKRCLLDKPYLGDLPQLKDIIPQTESKNYSYSQTAYNEGILASSKGKYNYTLSMPSYRDGRICCEGEDCEKLNKDYPLCKDLGEIEVGYECASEVVSPDLNPPPADCPPEDKPAVSTRNCIEGCGTETTVISCRDGKWHEEWVGDCQTQPTTTQTTACRSYDSKYCSGTAKTQWKCQGTGEQRAWKEVWNTSNCSYCSSGGGGSSYWGSPTKATFITFSGYNGTAFLKSDAILCGGACNAEILKTSNPRTVTSTCATEEEAEQICRSGVDIGCVTSFASLPTTCTYSDGADYKCVPQAWTECGDYKGYAFPSEMQVWEQALAQYDVYGTGMCSQGATTETECSGTYSPKSYSYKINLTNRHGKTTVAQGTFSAIRVGRNCSEYGEDLECTKSNNTKTCNAIYATELSGWTCGSYPSEFTGQSCPADKGSGGTGGGRPNCGYGSQDTTNYY